MENANPVVSLQSGSLLGKVLLFALLISSGAAAIASESHAVNKNWRSIAIKGYDPVAYFTMQKPVKGSSKHEVKWLDARWRFATEKHKELFVANPDKYAPRFGGFCTGGIALGRKAPIDPEAWMIVKGKLYLNYDKKGRDDMAMNPEAMIKEAEASWKILNTAPSQ